MSPSAGLAAALSLRTAAERAQYGPGEQWQQALKLTDEALEAATRALGAKHPCLAPFLEAAGAAAAASHNPERAGALYRQALALPFATEPRLNRQYHAALLEGLAGVLARGAAESFAQTTSAQAEEARRAVTQAAEERRRLVESDRPYDRYEVMQSWISPVPVQPIFWGPATGPQVLDWESMFGSAAPLLWESHALSLLAGKALDFPELYRKVEAHYLNGLEDIALAQSNQALLRGIATAYEARARSFNTATGPADQLAAALDWSAAAVTAWNMGDVDLAARLQTNVPDSVLNANRALALSSYDQRAALAILKGDFSAAEPLLSKAQSGLDLSPESREVFFNLERALALLHSGDLAGARQKLQVFVDRDRNGPEHQARVLRFLASLSEREGKSGDAILEMRRSIDVLKPADLDGSITMHSPLDYGIDPRTAHLSKSLDEAMSMALAGSAGDALREYALDAALRIKGRQLAASTDRFWDWQNKPLGAKEKLQRMRAVRALLNADLRRASGDTDWASIHALLDEDKRMQTDLGSQLGNAAATPTAQEASVRQLRQTQPADTAIVVFVVYHAFDLTADVVGLPGRGDPQLAALWLLPGQPVRIVRCGPLAGIEQAVEQLRSGVAPAGDPAQAQHSRPLPDEGVTRKAGAALASALFRGLDARTLSSLRHLVIFPEGELNLVPFAALVTGDGRYLGERLAIRLVSSLGDLAGGARGEAATSPAVIIADPDFNTARVPTIPALAGLPAQAAGPGLMTWPSLSGTRHELTYVRAALPDAVVHTEGDASKAALLAVEHPRILHIATHAGFESRSTASDALPAGTTSPRLAEADNPMLGSYLVLAGANNHAIGEDAFVTAAEVEALDLHGTQLAVLSACETGLGGVTIGEGVFGLRRALASAGAQRVLVSLWKVDDEATAELMRQLYDALGRGLQVDEALAAAQSALREARPPLNREWAHPHYWAGFVLSGARGTVQLERRTQPGTSPATAVEPAGHGPRGSTVAWRFPTGARLSSSPVVAGDLVLVGNQQGSLRALVRRSGELRWSKEAGGAINGTPQVLADRVYFGTLGGTSGDIYALDLATGREIWKSAAQGPVQQPLTFAQGVIYAATNSSSVHALDAADGHLLWTFTADHKDAAPFSPDTLARFTTPPLLYKDHVYIGESTGRLYKLDALNGRNDWTVTVGRSAGPVDMRDVLKVGLNRPVAADDLLVVATWGGRTQALDIKTGAERWHFDAGYDYSGLMPLAKFGDLCVLVSGSRMTALDPRSGQRAWQLAIDTSANAFLLPYGRDVYFGGQQGLWVLDTEHDVQTRVFAVAGVEAAPAVAGDTLYVSSVDGTLYALQ
jgi:CHAT domain-containing protein/outer membrane protein assembly factor BamB